MQRKFSLDPGVTLTIHPEPVCHVVNIYRKAAPDT